MQSYTSYQPTRHTFSPPQTKQPRRKRLLVSFLIIIAIVIIGLLSVTVWQAHQRAVLLKQQQAQRTSLISTTKTIMAAHPTTTVSLSLENIHTKQIIQVGSTRQFEAASTAKVLTTCAYYHLVETGQKSLTSQIGAYSADYQIKQMINQSNNISWNYLTNSIGLDNLQTYANSIHIPYGVDGNLLTTNAMAQTLTALYSGSLLNKDHTRLLLSYMQHTNDDSLIPPAIPSTMTLYHKYGLLDGNLHDAAIIVNKSEAWSLVIYTKNTDDSDDQARTAMIQQLSHSAVQYIQKMASLQS